MIADILAEERKEKKKKKTTFTQPCGMMLPGHMVVSRASWYYPDTPPSPQKRKIIIITLKRERKSHFNSRGCTTEHVPLSIRAPLPLSVVPLQHILLPMSNVQCPMSNVPGPILTHALTCRHACRPICMQP